MVSRYLGRNNNNPNNVVLIAMKVNPISGKTPPYSLRIVLKNLTYIKRETNKPNIIQPYGLRYFELEMNIKQSHKKELATTNTKKSDSNPKAKILTVSIITKEV